MSILKLAFFVLMGVFAILVLDFSDDLTRTYYPYSNNGAVIVVNIYFFIFSAALIFDLVKRLKRLGSSHLFKPLTGTKIVFILGYPLVAITPFLKSMDGLLERFEPATSFKLYSIALWLLFALILTVDEKARFEIGKPAQEEADQAS